MVKWRWFIEVFRWLGTYHDFNNWFDRTSPNSAPLHSCLWGVADDQQTIITEDVYSSLQTFSS